MFWSVFVMDYSVKLQSLLQIEKRKWVFLVGLVALTHLVCQSLMLPYGSALLALLPNQQHDDLLKTDEPPSEEFSSKTAVDDILHQDVSSNLPIESLSLLVRGVKNKDGYHVEGNVIDDKESLENDKEEKIKSDIDHGAFDDGFDFVEDETLGDVNVAADEGLMLPSDTNPRHGPELRIGEGASDPSHSLIQLANGSSGPPTNLMLHNDTIKDSSPIVSAEAKPSIIESVIHRNSESQVSSLEGSELGVSTNKIRDASAGGLQSLENKFTTFENSSFIQNKPVRKKMRCDMPPKTVTPIHEMQQLLARHRARSRAMRPRWSSEHDKDILAAKLRIENAPILKNERELYAPLFRNISMFKRSYELMERQLKIYVYKDGEKPIFHQPILKGLYASEGWFMKLMIGNKHYIVKDPRKAHLFYMPFSTRMLEYTLYVRNSHNRTNLRHYLKDYSEKIAAKYRYWNRTGGADHFLVACHDWAPYETRHHMEHCIKALCNADVTLGFKIGRDVSLPETYVRSARNPLRDLGGKPASLRHILAFYAGNMHGYLRPILLKHWNDKESDMKILGPMPPGVASKMNYINHMKNSRFCICPKGYEVNSPRIVESIFYECVPVIISDNFVPPLFEVLNWDAFSVIVAEKDIPNLRNILVSIPEQKYLDLQLGVRKVQQHFLWHAKPLKYDLFHMTLHSIWYNRVFQMKPR